jgi:hypothetical protein
MVVVAAQVTAIAYLYHPKWKAIILTLPLPFTASTMAVGAGVDVYSVTALMLWSCFMLAVWLLYKRFNVHILLAVVAAALVYAASAFALRSVLPRTEAAFWVACAVGCGLALLLYRRMPYREELGQRANLPIWIKLPITLAIVACLVAVKGYMQGFITCFPIVGSMSAYEARTNLYTLCRQVPAIVITNIALMIPAHLLQSSIGLLPALLAGWAAFLLILGPVQSWIGATRHPTPSPAPATEAAV